MVAEIQGFADPGEHHNLYDALKRVYGPSDRSMAPVRFRDAAVLFSLEEDILKR